MLKNAAHPASWMLLARWWFLTMLAVLQVFVIDRVVGAHQRERRLVVKVLPLALHLLMRLGEQCHRLACGGCSPSCGERHGAARSSARARLCDTSRDEKMRVPSESVANDSKPRSMPVSCPVGGKRLYRHIGAREADIPAVRFPADRDGLGRALQRAGPAHGNAPDLGEDQEAIVQRAPRCRTACR